MNHSLPGLIGEVPRKAHAASVASGEAERKSFALLIGRAIERGILLAGMTKQEAAFEMGYPDPSALSRWIAGVETVQFSRLWMIARLRPCLCVALAEISEGVVVETTISIRRAG